MYELENNSTHDPLLGYLDIVFYKLNSYSQQKTALRKMAYKWLQVNTHNQFH